MTTSSLESAEPVRRTARRGLVRTALRRPLPLIAFVYLVLLTLAALAAGWIAPYDPDVQSLAEVNADPSWEHLFGTDQFGRDVLSRMLFGARIALIAPVIALTAAVLIGVPAGIWAGLHRGWLDAVAGRLADTLLSLPGLVVALAVIAILGPGLWNVMLAIGILFAPYLFRIVRGVTLDVAAETYIESARAVGCGTWRIMWVHVFPNVAAPLLVQVNILMGISLLLEASLSFLGLGIAPPASDWGSMLGDAYRSQYQAPLAAIPPGLALCITVLAFNTLGDGIRDALAARRSR
ncbi:ABC transporter permease [Pseudonocardia zijingensis]|jgi:peptide/nickel transport system permease protein|uniref:ABC transporter permease n=1 Tax=Pseudonocardia zijingensis TaxID=153376 RepID=A0ABP4AFJ6_9PSEU